MGVTDFEESKRHLSQRTVRRLGMYTKLGNTDWKDVDNPYIMQAINLPSVMQVILANAEMLKREADIKALRRSIEESEAKADEARKSLESMGVIV